jgi:hypothetical protein
LYNHANRNRNRWFGHIRNRSRQYDGNNRRNLNRYLRNRWDIRFKRYRVWNHRRYINRHIRKWRHFGIDDRYIRQWSRRKQFWNW